MQKTILIANFKIKLKVMKRAYQILRQKGMVNVVHELFQLKNKIKQMKRIALFIGMLLLAACSSTQFLDSWKNKEITSFEPKKVLVVGITDNLTARKLFEEKLKNAFILRNIYTTESMAVIDNGFSTSKKSEEEIDTMIKKIANEGFDTVVITSVKGVEERVDYSSYYYPSIGYRWSRFGRYYYWYQDIYYTPRYYDYYKVYNVETVIYSINENDTKSLVWVGAMNLVDPQKINTAVNDYVENIIKQLEKENLIKAIK
jgi:hypothetical protein